MALVHITERSGPSSPESAPILEWHFCEVCADEYQFESKRYLENHTSEFDAGMSKLERAAATAKLRDEMRRHMADWVSRR
jgi:hypothetical protein